jgi:Ser/Thr protein kinase RdoA (MazF antagonist)
MSNVSASPPPANDHAMGDRSLSDETTATVDASDTDRPVPPPGPEPAADHAAVFEHFGVAPADRPVESCYLFAPVFPVPVAGRKVAVKRTVRPIADAEGLAAWLRALAASGFPVVTPAEVPMANPAEIGEDVWVAYSWIEGRPYDGSLTDVAAAGDLLGRLHAAGVPDDGVPRFRWPDHDDASVAEDVTGLRRVLSRYAPDDLAPVLGRLGPMLTSFMTETLPTIRSAALPTASVSLDYKANNLVYTGSGPVFIDPDNAEHAVRLLDLANATLLFHNDMHTVGRLFTAGEWAVFRDAYLRHVTLTDEEHALWPVAVRYMLLEWAVWTLIDAERWDDWVTPGQRDFLLDLARTEEDRFPLGD